MRALTRLISTLLVLAVAVAIGDTAARFLVQTRLATELETSQKLPSTPSVTIGGFPFLTQAVAGRYDSVTVTTGAIPASGASGGLGVSSVNARLSGVTVPLREALDGSVKVVPVSRIQADALISFADLETVVSRELDAYVSGLSLSRASDSTVTVRGTVKVAGVTAPLSAPVRVTASGSRITLAVVASGLTGIPDVARAAVADALSLTVPLPRLPYGLAVSGVAVTSDGITARATASGVRLAVS